MLDKAAGWDDLVIGLRPATRGTKGKVCQSSYLRWCSETGEGIERRVASSPSAQHRPYPSRRPWFPLPAATFSLPPGSCSLSLPCSSARSHAHRPGSPASASARQEQTPRHHPAEPQPTSLGHLRSRDPGRPRLGPSEAAPPRTARLAPRRPATRPDRAAPRLPRRPSRVPAVNQTDAPCTATPRRPCVNGVTASVFSPSPLLSMEETDGHSWPP
jgi:hypothetical protein